MKKLKSNTLLSSVRIGDLVIIAAALCMAVIFIVSARPTPGNTKQLLLIHGDNITKLSWRPVTMNIYDMTGRQMIIEIESERARVLSSNCPDKLCIHSGWVSECGHIAACLPNGVALMVECQGNFNVTNP